MAREYKDSANREHSYAGINYAEEQPVLERKLKDSGIEWIGEIPAEWKTEKAKHVFVQRREKGNEDCTLLAATQKYGMYPQHLLEGVVKVSSDTDMQQFKTVHINDYVISLRSFQGGFELSNYEGVCSPAYQVFSAHKAINNIFFKYLFKSDAFIQQINAFVLGIREGKNIQYDDFSTMYLPIPSLDEQQRIADFLDEKCGEIDKLVALQEQMIEELKAYKQSVIIEAVTKGLNPYAPMRDSGIDWIGKVPKGWKVCKLKNVFSLLNGRAYLDPELLETGKYRILRVGNLFSSDKWYYSDMELDNNKYCESGDLLYGWSASIGPYIWKEEKVIYHYHIWKVLFGNNDLYYSFYMLQALTMAKQRDMHGSAMQHLTKVNMDNSIIVMPPIDEQRTIVSYLDTKCAEIDKLISIKQNKISKLKEYKKSIIFEYVTGKKYIK